MSRWTAGNGRQRPRPTVLVLLTLAALVLGGIGAVSGPSGPAVTASAAAATFVPVRVNAGGPVVTTGGVQWAADAGFSGGKPYTNAKVTQIAGTTDDVLYRTERSATSDRGSFGYSFPVPAGTYRVRLHLAEIYFGATGGGAAGTGKRVFSVNAEGGPVEVANLDLNAQVAPMTALVREVVVPVSDGRLDLAFTASVNQPKVSAIEILAADGTVTPTTTPTTSPTTTPTTTPPTSTTATSTSTTTTTPTAATFVPVRVNAGGPAVTTGGVQWAADTGFSGGKPYTNAKVTQIAGTTDDVLYRTERSATSDRGSFGYSFPVPAGTYRVRLHLAEIYFGATGGGAAGTGKRVFSVNAEGGPVEVANLDLNAQVAPMTALVREVVVPVSDGRLELAFTASVNQPKVSAIEILAADGTVTPTTTPTSPPTTSAPTSPPPPQVMAWAPTAPVPQRLFEANGLAADGRLWVLGGFSSSSLDVTGASYSFSPGTGRWTALPAMPEPLTHAGVAWHGRSIWLVGGYVGKHPGGATTHTWVFDTVASTWRRGPDLPAPRGGGGAAVIGGTLHFVGGTSRVAGSTADPDHADHWTLDVTASSPTWRSAARLPLARNHVGVTAVDGELYVVGGQLNHREGTTAQDRVDVYDPVTRTWRRAAPLPGGRSHLVSSTFAADNRLLAVSGSENDGGGGRPMADVVQYDPGSDTWAELPPLPVARKGVVAGIIGDRLYVATGNPLTADAWSAQYVGAWQVGVQSPTALGEVAAGVIGSRVVVVGEGGSATLAYDLSSRTWRTDLARRPYPGHHHAAEVIGGKLWLFGGLGNGAGKVQVYDPVANSWSTRRDMPIAAGSVSTALIGGKVYAAGGIVGSSTTSGAAVYDPVTNVWSPLPDMPQGRNHAAAAGDGRSLWVFGGRGGGNTVSNGSATVQRYDTVTRTWTSSDDPASGIAPMPVGRGGTGKAVFLDGRFVVMGGETLNGSGATATKTYTRVDVYDPVLGTWSAQAPMPTGRHGIFPVDHQGSVVVVLGGTAAGNSQSTVVEILVPRAR